MALTSGDGTSRTQGALFLAGCRHKTSFGAHSGDGVAARKPKVSDMEEEQIDANLRRIFHDNADEELPADLQDLIDKLDDLELPEGVDDQGENAE